TPRNIVSVPAQTPAPHCQVTLLSDSGSDDPKASGQPEGEHLLVLGADVESAVYDGRGGVVDVRGDVGGPQMLSGRGVEGVDGAVVQHAVGDCRARVGKTHRAI